MELNNDEMYMLNTIFHSQNGIHLYTLSNRLLYTPAKTFNVSKSLEEKGFIIIEDYMVKITKQTKYELLFRPSTKSIVSREPKLPTSVYKVKSIPLNSFFIPEKSQD
jgi:hypothetical protein